MKSQDWFDAWVSKLRHHRLYRQNEIVRSPRDASFHIFPATSTAESSPAANVSVVDGKVWPCSAKISLEIAWRVIHTYHVCHLKALEVEGLLCEVTLRRYHKYGLGRNVITKYINSYFSFLMSRLAPVFL